MKRKKKRGGGRWRGEEEEREMKAGVSSGTFQGSLISVPLSLNFVQDDYVISTHSWPGDT